MPQYRRIARKVEAAAVAAPADAPVVRQPEVVKTGEPEVTVARELPSDVTSLKKDELVALAEKRGVDASGTKADIVERLNG